jgi:hypothetical protein
LGELVKVALKGSGGKRGGWVGKEILGLLGFVALVFVWVLDTIENTRLMSHRKFTLLVKVLELFHRCLILVLAYKQKL